MGFAVLCLLPLLIPQEPAPGLPPTPTTVQQPQPVDDAAALCAAEREPAKADVATLQRLAIAGEAEVAARAAFLLARGKGEANLAACGEVLANSSSALARQQAMQGLLQNGDAKATNAAIRALDDADRTVRTLAVQALGKWRRPAGVEPLLALIDDHRDDQGTAVTEVTAALLALHDLGAHDHLLRAATAIDGGKVPG
ncbi:MAG: HEAT repeat domain-containing protein, partial [Planctomycetes bacterium]|nr:HEAT repeat domain-containing protein [Planctomycetota bacterium]